MLMALQFSRQFFEKCSEKFLENPASGSRVVPYERMDERADGHDEDNSRFSQFCGRA
jgi:hypothetical protein